MLHRVTARAWSHTSDWDCLGLALCTVNSVNHELGVSRLELEPIEQPPVKAEEAVLPFLVSWCMTPVIHPSTTALLMRGE